MEVHLAEKAFQRLFDAFPSYREFVVKEGSGNATLDAWCGMLTDCEAEDVEAVVDGMVRGQIELRSKYDTKDMLPLNIRGRARQRKDVRVRAERKRKQQEQSYYLTEENARSENQKRIVRFGDAMRLSRLAGAASDAGVITREENKEWLALILDWHMQGGEKPELPEDVVKAGEQRLAMKWPKRNEARLIGSFNRLNKETPKEGEEQ